jgi:3-hydroxy-3-methylglutaryl CoA synthase
MERAAAVAYGWGSGAAAASFVVKDRINDMEARPYVITQLENKIMVDYASALKYEKKLDRNLKGLSSYY